jgi:hypothetical protein
MDESALKHSALAAVSYLAASARPEDADRLAPVLGQLAGLADQLPPGSLFADWAQPAHPRVVPVIVDGSYTPELAAWAVDGGRAVATASAERDASCAAAGALSEGPAAFWAAPPDAPTSWWQVALDRPLPLALVQLSWRFSGAVRGLPERYVVSTSADGGATWRSAPGGDVVVDHLPPHALSSQAVPLPGLSTAVTTTPAHGDDDDDSMAAAGVTHVRVTCYGYAKSAPPGLDGKPATHADAAGAAVKERGHSLGHMALFTRDATAPHVTPNRTLHDQLRLAALAAVHGREPAAVAAGLSALSSLSLAAGSAQGLLQTALALVAIQKAPPLPRSKQAGATASGRRPAGGAGGGRSLLAGARAPGGGGGGGGSDLSDGGGGGGDFHDTPPTSPLPVTVTSTAGIKARASPGSPLLGSASVTAADGSSSTTVVLPPSLAALPAPRAALRTSHLSALAPPPAPLAVVDGASASAAPAGFDAAAFMRRLASATDEALEQMLTAGREEPPPLVPRWDADCKSGNVELSADDTLMTSTTSTKAVSDWCICNEREWGARGDKITGASIKLISPTASKLCRLLRSPSFAPLQHVYGTVGFNRGKAAWEFVIEKDSDRDECTCVGAGVKPVVSSQYETSPNLFMVRGYNGRCHAGGVATGTVDKFHPGDTVRFELDCDAGEVRMWVNAKEQGVVFRGLAGQTVFPAACTYSENRAVAFRRLEAWGQTAGGEGEVAVAALGDMAQGRLGIASTTTAATTTAAVMATAAVTPGSAAAAAAPAAALTRTTRLFGAPVAATPAAGTADTAAAESLPFDFESFVAAAAAGAHGTAAQSAAPLLTPAAGGDVTAATAAAGGQTPLPPSTPRSATATSFTPRLSATPAPSAPLLSSQAPARPFIARNEPLLRIRHEGHYVSGGFLDGVPAGARAGAGVSLPSSASLGSPGVGGNGGGVPGALAQLITVAGVTCYDGLSLRPDAISGSPALVSYPLTVPLPLPADAGASAASAASGARTPTAGTPSAASAATAPFYEPQKRARPFEWFVGRVGVDDTSWWPPTDGAPVGGAGAGRLVPVVVSVYADNREVWTSPPLSRPGESHFCRAYIGGATALTLLARFVDQVPQYAVAPAAAAPSLSTGTPAGPVRRTPTLSLSGSSLSSTGPSSSAAAVHDLSQHWPPLDPAAAAGSPLHAGAAGPRVAPKTVWQHACVLQRRSWAWSSSVRGAPPVFVDNVGTVQQSSQQQQRHAGSGLPHGSSPRLRAASTASIGSPVAGASSPGPGRPSPMLRASASPPAAGGVGPSPRHVPSTLARVRSFDGIALPPPAVGAGPHLPPLSLVSGSPPASPTVTGSAEDAVGAPQPVTPGGTHVRRAGRRVGGGGNLQLPGPALQSPHAAQPPVLTAGITAAISPLALARFILSRLAFLSEARLDAVARGTAAAQRVAKLLGVPLRSAEEASAAAAGAASGDRASPGGAAAGGVSVSTLAVLAQERLRVQRLQVRAAASKSKGGASTGAAAGAVDPATTITAAEVSAIAALAALRAPFCLDVCVATLHTLHQLLAAALPRVWLETAAAAAAATAPPKASGDAAAVLPSALAAPDVTATTLAAAGDGSGGALFATGGGVSLFGSGGGLSVFAPAGSTSSSDVAGGSGAGGSRPMLGAGLPRPPALATALAASATSTPRAAGGAASDDAPAVGTMTRLPPPRVQADADAKAAAAAPWTAIARATLTLLQCHLRQLVASGADLASIGVLPAPAPQPSGKEAAFDGANGGIGGPLGVDHTSGRAAATDVAGGAHDDGDDGVSWLRALVAAQALSCGDAVTSLGPGPAAPSTARLVHALSCDPVFAGGTASSTAGAAGGKRGPTTVEEDQDGASALSLTPLHRLLQLIVSQGGGSGGGIDGHDSSDDEAAASAAPVGRDGVHAFSSSRLHASGASSPGKPAAATGGGGGRLPLSLQAAAGDAIDAGLHVFYPSPHQRRELLAGLVARGATVELQFRFPAYLPLPPPAARPTGSGGGGNGKDADSKAAAAAAVVSPLRDLRWERALLLVQLEAEARGWRCELVGAHGGCLHLLVRLPPAAPAQTAAAGKGAAHKPRGSPKPRQQQQQPATDVVDGTPAVNGSVAVEDGAPRAQPSGLTVRVTRPGDAGRGKRKGPAAAAPKRQRLPAGPQQQPSSSPAAAPLGPGLDFLERGLQVAFARAGLGRWSVPAGCADPPVALSIQRVVAAPAHAGLQQQTGASDGGDGATSAQSGAGTAAAAGQPPAPVGVVRVYPRSTGSFAAVLAAVRAAAEKQYASPPSSSAAVGESPAPARLYVAVDRDRGGHGAAVNSEDDSDGSASVPVRRVGAPREAPPQVVFPSFPSHPGDTEQVGSYFMEVVRRARADPVHVLSRASGGGNRSSEQPPY